MTGHIPHGDYVLYCQALGTEPTPHLLASTPRERAAAFPAWMSEAEWMSPELAATRAAWNRLLRWQELGCPPADPRGIVQAADSGHIKQLVIDALARFPRL